jgi:hypothetical protein
MNSLFFYASLCFHFKLQVQWDEVLDMFCAENIDQILSGGRICLRCKDRGLGSVQYISIGFASASLEPLSYPFGGTFVMTNFTPVQILAYACKSPRTFAYSLFIFLVNSCFLTGRVLNICSTMTVVPLWAATIFLLLSFPENSNSNLLPFGAVSDVAVIIWRFERAQRELRASPRNPKVLTFERSAYVRNFEV